MRRIAGILFILGALSQSAVADKPGYQTGFEGAAFPVGQPLDGLDNWVAFSPGSSLAATITDKESSQGNKSVTVEDLLLPFDGWSYGFFDAPTPYIEPTAKTRYVTVSWDGKLNLGYGGAEIRAGMQFYDGYYQFLGWLEFHYLPESNTVQIWATGGYDETTGEAYFVTIDVPGFDPNKWYKFTSEIDLETMTISFFFEGKYLGTGPIAPPFERSFQLASYNHQVKGGPVGSSSSFDNVRVTTSKHSAVPKK